MMGAQVTKAVKSTDDADGFLRVRMGSIILQRCAPQFTLSANLSASSHLFFLPFLPASHSRRVVFTSALAAADKVVALLGKGTFAHVFHCDDRVAKRPVALKVVRNIEKYSKAARTEIEILGRLTQVDPSNSKYVRLCSCFVRPKRISARYYSSQCPLCFRVCVCARRTLQALRSHAGVIHFQRSHRHGIRQARAQLV